MKNIFIFNLQDSIKRQRAQFVPCITVSLDPSLTLRLNNLQHAVNVSYWGLILTVGDPRFFVTILKTMLTKPVFKAAATESKRV